MAYLHLHVPNPTDDGFNVAAPGANTDILVADLTPNRAGWFVGSIVLATASVVNYVVKQGVTTFAVGLDESSTIPAGDVYSFGFPVHPDFTYNFQVETNGVIRQLVVSETDAPPGLPSNLGTVTVGDVTVTSVTPGTGARNLGKAADAASGATDTGVAPVAVRDDALSALTPVEGDYVPLRVDANGALWASISASLPAGTNAIGKLAANSGVDIGDVDVLSVIPGTGATSLGKAIDAASGGTDTGVAPVAVRDDALSALTPVEGDYVPLRVDANGALWASVSAALPAGTNNIGDVDVLSVVPGTAATNLGKAIDAVAGGTDTGVAPLAVRDDALSALTPVEGDYVPLRVDANGATWVSVSAALPAGTNNIGDVDVLSVVPGTGATNLGKAADAAAGATDTGVAPLAVRDDALSALTPVEGDYVPLRVDANGATWVSVSAALPAGTNNVGDVDVLSVIPGTGATNLGKAADAVAGATDTGVAPLAIRDDALSTLTPAEGDYAPLRVDSTGAQWVADPGVGGTADAAATPGGTGSLSAKLRNVTSLLDSIKTAVELIDNAVAGTNFSVVGLNASVAKDVTLQTAAYAAEDCLGGKFVFSAVSRTSGVGVFLKGFQFTLEDTNSPTPEVHLWLALAALTSAPADNASMSAGAANAFGATDRDTLMGPFTVGTGDWEACDGQTLTFYKEVSKFLAAPTTQRDYGAILKTGTALAQVAATRNLRVTMEVGRN